MQMTQPLPIYYNSQYFGFMLRFLGFSVYSVNLFRRGTGREEASAFMKNDPTKLSLTEILDEVEALAKETGEIFGSLNAGQINWKPTADAWSVGQCFDHLVTANREYFPQLDQIIKGEKNTTMWQRMPFLPGFFGQIVIGAVHPDSSKKLKAPKIFHPSSSKIDPLIITKFIAHQREMIGKMKATMGMKLEKIIIYSPVTKVVIYSLLDAYRIITAHERRHFNQAHRLKEMPGFPSDMT
jgi:hypothetical protein